MTQQLLVWTLGSSRCNRVGSTTCEGIVNLFISPDEFSSLRGFFGHFHSDSSRKKTEKRSLFPTFTKKETHQCLKLTIPYSVQEEEPCSVVGKEIEKLFGCEDAFEQARVKDSHKGCAADATDLKPGWPVERLA
jgi:hypothetical protein